MDEGLLKFLIGAAGAIGGAIVAAIANMYAANRKIKEIELAYSFKMRDGYLENARKLTAEVYIPINVFLTQLTNAYDTFRARIDFEKNEVPDGSRNFFLGQCRKYLSDLDQLFGRGADAYLTTELDDRIRNFNSFLRESLESTAPMTKSVFESDLRIAGIPSGLQSYELISASKLAFLAPNFSLRLAGIRLGYMKQLLAAPLHSRAFEKRFQIEVPLLKSLIKEVTLGSHSRPQ